MKSLSQTYYRLRSSQDQTLLRKPFSRKKKKKKKLGDRAFMYAAPKLWNNLPLFKRKSATVNEFKTMLKSKNPSCLLIKNYACFVCYIVMRSRLYSILAAQYKCPYVLCYY